MLKVVTLWCGGGIGIEDWGLNQFKQEHYREYWIVEVEEKEQKGKNEAKVRVERKYMGCSHVSTGRSRSIVNASESEVRKAPGNLQAGIPLAAVGDVAGHCSHTSHFQL